MMILVDFYLSYAVFYSFFAKILVLLDSYFNICRQTKTSN